MQLFPGPQAPGPQLEGATLLMPAVAFANIGELALDALVATLRLQRLAAVDDPNVLPCVGNNPYRPEPPGTLATAMELYGSSPDARCFLLQQRAPAITGRQRHFADAVAAWARSARLARVVLLAGLDAQFRREAQLEGGSQLRWTAQEDGAAAQACRGLQLEELEADALATELEVHGALPPWPLLEGLRREGVPATLLTTWASEGDNLPDARRMASAALRVLQGLPGCLLEEEEAAAAAAVAEAGGGEAQLVTPCSWVGLYGA